MPLSVVLDTSVLYPFHLRDTLLQTAEAYLYRPLWSPDILAELQDNLMTKAGLARSDVDRLIAEMTRTFRSALVTGYQASIPLVSHLTNDPDDRHVLAAAVHSRANKIVTSNRKHFPRVALAQVGIVSQSPDDFLCELFTVDQESMNSVIQRQANAYRRPPLSVPELLASLEPDAPRFANQVRTRLLADQL